MSIVNDFVAVGRVFTGFNVFDVYEANELLLPLPRTSTTTVTKFLLIVSVFTGFNVFNVFRRNLLLLLLLLLEKLGLFLQD